MLEKNGLGPAAAILENYGIDSETDVSLLDQGDLRNLVSQGLKPMQLKKLEHWCEGVRARAEKTLPSSLNTPTAAALLSSEALNVLTLPAPCTAESVSDNEGERDGDEDGGEEDDEDSDNDLQIVLEQSGTADSAGAASGGTESPAKKAKITLTEEEENFAKQFRPTASKIDKSNSNSGDKGSRYGCGSSLFIG